MFYLVSYSEEYISLAIHANSASKEDCQKTMKELVIADIQAKYGHDINMAELIYNSAKNAVSADDEDAVFSQYGVNVHVYEDGASFDDGYYMNKYQIIDYTSGQCE